MSRRRAVLGAASFAAFWLLAAAAGAAIIATSGAATEIAPPPSVELGALESNTTIFAFDEQQVVTLASDVSVDITDPGLYDESGDLTPGTIAAGTRVSSHLVHADRVGSRARPKLVLDGTVTVDQDILGLIVLNSTLDASDGLGVPGTTYPGAEHRQLSFDNQEDAVTLSADRRTVTLHLQLKRHSDQVRIITAEPRCRREDDDETTDTEDGTTEDDTTGDGTTTGDTANDGGTTGDTTGDTTGEDTCPTGETTDDDTDDDDTTDD